MRTKAIPSDIDKFFEGTSVFFPSSDTSVSPPPPDKKLSSDHQVSHTERANERTGEPNERTGERAKGVAKREMGRVSHGVNDAVEPTHAHPMDASQNVPAQVRERAVQQSVSSQPPISETAPTTPTPSAAGMSLALDGAQPPAGASILDRLKQGKSDPQELTERYSFEIYRRQKEQIEDFLYAYKKKTGERLSASRFIREAITLYFHLVTSGETQ